MYKMNVKEIIGLLRNPYKREEGFQEARLEAANILERLMLGNTGKVHVQERLISKTYMNLKVEIDSMDNRGFGVIKILLDDNEFLRFTPKCVEIKNEC